MHFRSMVESDHARNHRKERDFTRAAPAQQMENTH